MSKVIDININKPHLSGSAICLECKHTWVSVSEVGDIVLICPKCELAKGVYQNLCEPSGDRWQCKCSNQHFYIEPDGLMCTYCGKRQEFA